MEGNVIRNDEWISMYGEAKVICLPWSQSRSDV